MSAQPASAPALVQNGLLELPPGKIAAVATYLEMRRDETVMPAILGGNWHFVPLAGAATRYRRLYAAIGGSWLWFSRAGLSTAEIARIVDNPDVEALALVRDGRDIGLVEIDFRAEGVCELAFLGLVPKAIGLGLGQVLVAEGMRRAFARPIERLWLHTCTLDHPSALRFYLRAGFRPYLRAIEIADDPRLNGRMPREAAPDVPIL